MYVPIDYTCTSYFQVSMDYVVGIVQICMQIVLNNPFQKHQVKTPITTRNIHLLYQKEQFFEWECILASFDFHFMLG